jgi:hypothetical protein
MRHSRMIVGLVAGACLFAVTAAPAMAEEFTASATGATKGETIGTQVFRLKPLTIKCTKGKSTGTVTALKSPTLVDEVKYTKCTAFGTPVRFLTPVVFEFNSNGTVKITNTVEIRISAIKCVATIEPQALPKEPTSKSKPITYSPLTFKGKGKRFEEKFPNGQKKLVIAAKVAKKEGIAYSLAGGLCSELEEPAGEEGSYSGELLDELVEGELS